MSIKECLLTKNHRIIVLQPNGIGYFLACALLFEAVLGGAGRLITIGPLSIRLIIFIISLVFVSVAIITRRIHLEGYSFFFTITFITYIMISAFLSVNNGSLFERIDSTMGYLTILLVLFFEIVSNYREQYINRMIHMYYCCMVALAVLAVIIWVWSFLHPNIAYSVIELRFFRPYVYGLFDFLNFGGIRIPRPFMKGTIYLGIGFIISLDSFIQKRTKKNTILLILFGIALLTTFSFGIYSAAAICFFLVLWKNKVFNSSKLFYSLVGLLFVLVIIYKLGIVDVMISRMLDSGENTFEYRKAMFNDLVFDFFDSPVLGKGMNYSFVTDFANGIKSKTHIEIMWLELLITTGVVGFSLFVFHIYLTIRRMYLLSNHVHVFLPLAIGVLFVCIESFSNPFMNSPIGLTYYAFCTGITNYYWIKYKRIRRFEGSVHDEQV